MAILNYTTEIKAGKTVGEINEILGNNKARKITVDHDEDSEFFGYEMYDEDPEEILP